MLESSPAPRTESNENDFPHLKTKTKSPKQVKHTNSSYSKLDQQNAEEVYHQLFD